MLNFSWCHLGSTSLKLCKSILWSPDETMVQSTHQPRSKTSPGSMCVKSRYPELSGEYRSQTFYPRRKSAPYQSVAQRMKCFFFGTRGHMKAVLSDKVYLALNEFLSRGFGLDCFAFSSRPRESEKSGIIFQENTKKTNRFNQLMPLLWATAAYMQYKGTAFFQQ